MERTENNAGTVIRKTVKRPNPPGHIHELPFSCYKNLDLLASDTACEHLARAIIRACGILEFSVIAYVFMPNHVHLLVNPLSDEYSISDFLKSVKQSSSRNELKRIRNSNPSLLKALATNQKHDKHRFWQDGGGYHRIARDKTALENMIEYIHNNPVRKNLASRPTDWKWSSAGDWLEGITGPIVVDKRVF